MPTPAMPTWAEVEIPAKASGTRRLMTWNVLEGGLDAGAPDRLLDQLALTARCAPDVLCIQEAAHWHEDDQRWLRLTAQTLGMRHLDLARSQRSRDGSNHTAMLYNGNRLRLVDQTTLGPGVFHHALIRARFRPRSAGVSDHSDFLVLGTHLNPYDGAARLGEARLMTDYGGPFPGMPPRAALLGDLNTPDREPDTWDGVPINLQARYRSLGDGGIFGPVDQDAVRVLLQSGWQEPHKALGIEPPPTVGHYYANERVPWKLDYALLAGLQPVQTWTYPVDTAFRLSDHGPHFVDVVEPD